MLMRWLLVAFAGSWLFAMRTSVVRSEAAFKRLCASCLRRKHPQAARRWVDVDALRPPFPLWTHPSSLRSPNANVFRVPLQNSFGFGRANFRCSLCASSAVGKTFVTMQPLKGNVRLRHRLHHKISRFLERADKRCLQCIVPAFTERFDVLSSEETALAERLPALMTPNEIVFYKPLLIGTCNENIRLNAAFRLVSHLAYEVPPTFRAFIALKGSFVAVTEASHMQVPVDALASMLFDWAPYDELIAKGVSIVFRYAAFDTPPVEAFLCDVLARLPQQNPCAGAAIDFVRRLLASGRCFVGACKSGTLSIGHHAIAAAYLDAMRRRRRTHSRFRLKASRNSSSDFSHAVKSRFCSVNLVSLPCGELKLPKNMQRLKKWREKKVK